MWGVPTDHEIFDEINSAQWLWYLYNFIKDKDERYNFTRDFTEYLASFIEPEAVQKVRMAREKAVKVDDSNFAHNIKNIFGRDLPGLEESSETDKNKTSHNVDMAELIKNMNAVKQEKSNSAFNYQHWTQFELE